MSRQRTANPSQKNRSLWHFWDCRCCTTDRESTRKKLLLAAYQEIHQMGFQAASLKKILQHTRVTKGALYHHFPSKKALGLAVLDELIAQGVQEHWLAPLEQQAPIDALIHIIQASGQQMTAEDIRLGCPLNNLAQEMAPVDEDFRRRIETIYATWVAGIADALHSGQQQGNVRQDVNPQSAATLIVAALEGCLGLAKTSQSPVRLQVCGNGLIDLLNSWRSSTHPPRNPSHD